MQENSTSHLTHAAVLKHAIDLMFEHIDLNSGLITILNLCKQVTGADAWVVLRQYAVEVPIAVLQEASLELQPCAVAEGIFARACIRNDMHKPDLGRAIPSDLQIYRSCLSTPLNLGSESLIAIALVSRTVGAFSNRDLSLLRQVASLIENTFHTHLLATDHCSLAEKCTNEPHPFLREKVPLKAGARIPGQPDLLLNRPEQILLVVDELLSATIAEINPAVARTLARIGDIAALDRAQVWRVSGTGFLKQTHEWASSGTEPVMVPAEGTTLASLASWGTKLACGNAVAVPNVQALWHRPKAPEPIWLQDSQSLMLVPIMQNTELVGLVVLQTIRMKREFLPDEIDMMRIVANAINIVMERLTANMDAVARGIALTVEKDRLQATLSTVPDLVLEFDINGYITSCFVGTDVKKPLLYQDIVGQHLEAAFPKELAALTYDMMLHIDRDSTVLEREFSLEFYGKKRHYRAIASAKSNQNKLAGYICVVREITDRFIERSQLRHLGKVAELTSNLVLITNAKQEIKWINPAFEKRTGWSLKDMQGRHPTEFVKLSETDPNAIDRMRVAFESAQVSQFELRLQSKSTQSFWVHAEVQPIFSDKSELDGFILMQTDITNLKKSYRRALKEGALALDASTDGIAFSTSDGFYTYMNFAHRQMFGIPTEEDVGKLHWRDLCPPEALVRVTADVLPELQSTGQWNGEMLGLHRNGSRIFQEVSLTVYENGLMCITRDISERITLEAERTHLRERLQIAQRQETIAFLASGVAHDLNNLVAVINGSVSLLKHSAQNDKKIETGVLRILRATGAIKDLVGGLSSLARSEKPYSTLDLRKVMKDGLDLVDSARFHSNPVTVNLPDESCPVWANSTELLQVIVNLVLNACDATGEGLNHVDISILGNVDLPEKQPDTGILTPDADYVLFAISDTGTGMDLDTRQKMFDSYFSTKSESGHGLGLPIVMSILRENSAALWVDSVPSMGTTMTIAWPSSPVESMPCCKNYNPDNTLTNLEGHNVLIVDDLPDVAEVFCDMLEAAGANGVAISDPFEAQKLLEEHPETWSALVTDLDMPGIGGVALARTAASCSPPIPTVLVTALDHNLGSDSKYFYRILIKPTQKSELISAVIAAAKARTNWITSALSSNT